MQRRIVWSLGLIGLLSVNAISATVNDAIRKKEDFHYGSALKIVESLPKSTDTVKYAGWEYLRNGQNDKAIELLAQIEDDYEASLGSGLACFLKQDYDRSLEYLRKSLKINKNCAVSEYLTGNIKAFQGDKEGAVEHYKAALKLDYNLLEAKLKLARLYLELKKHNEAYKEWAQLADIDPQNAEARTQKQALLALITKKPEEIIPPSRITQPSTLAAAPDTERIPLMRIGVLQGVKELSFWSRDGFVVCEDTFTLCEADNNEVFTINIAAEQFKGKWKLSIRPKSEDSGIIVRDIKYAAGYAWAGTADREYRGTMEAVSDRRGLR